MGFCASVVSDTVSNSIRVMKTYASCCLDSRNSHSRLNLTTSVPTYRSRYKRSNQPIHRRYQVPPNFRGANLVPRSRPDDYQARRPDGTVWPRAPDTHLIQRPAGSHDAHLDCTYARKGRLLRVFVCVQGIMFSIAWKFLQERIMD